MENHFFEDIKQVIQSFKQKLEQHLPAMKLEVSNLIFSKSKDKNKIENTLDTLLSLIDIGIGKELFIQLLEYYKTVDADGAAFYWNEFDKMSYNLFIVLV